MRENLFLNPIAAGKTAFSFLAPGRESRASVELGREVGLRPNNPGLPIELLSGGNQQKVVVGRWLHLAAKLYVFEDPTAGVDVGAKAEIYRLFDVALQTGAAILIVSTDFERSPKSAIERSSLIVAGLLRNWVQPICRWRISSPPRRPTSPIRRKSPRRPSKSQCRGHMQSIKSNALEPTRSELAGLSRWRALVRLLPVYGLPILTVLLIIFFSLLLPDTFPTYLNFRSILADKAIIALLSLAATLPMMAGRIDLTVGFGIVMWHILAIGLQVKYGVPWPLAILIVLACAALVGLINGILVEVAQINSFIATLGTGTILYAIALWFTEGRQIIGSLAPGFIDINTLSIAGIPIPAIYVMVLAIFLWIVSERLPLGRYIYAIGANEKAAALNGIPVRAYVIGVFVGSGLICGFAGCVLAAKLRIGQANVGLDYLLPALVGAFLGSTTIKPGRVNVWGTMFGVLILAVGISGIQQLGGSFFVEPLFNGTTLVVSIALAAFAQRRRAVARPTRGTGDAEAMRVSSERERTPALPGSAAE